MRCVVGGLRTIPLDEVLEALRVFKDSADGAQNVSLEALLAVFSKIEQHVYAFDVEEMNLATLVAEDTVRQAVDDTEQESRGVTRLLDLSVGKILLEELNAVLTTELFLVVAVITAQV